MYLSVCFKYLWVYSMAKFKTPEIHLYLEILIFRGNIFLDSHFLKHSQPKLWQREPIKT